MWRWMREIHLLLFSSLLFIVTPVPYISASDLSESKSLFHFIRVVDPQNVLRINWEANVPDPCTSVWMGVKCDALSSNITEIRLESLNLSGTIDADSLCKLPYLRVLSLAANHITGGIPESLSNCHSLVCLNLRTNLLHGIVPATLRNLKSLRSLDISDNNLTGHVPHFKQETEPICSRNMESNLSKGDNWSSPKDSEESKTSTAETRRWISTSLALAFLLALFCLFVFCTNKIINKPTEENALKGLVQEHPVVNVSVGKRDDVKKETENLDLVLFDKRYERFSRDDLLNSGADLQGHNIYSSLYKVKLENNVVIAVKRLKNLQVFDDDFRRKITWIGKLKHPNLLRLVAYHSSEDDKLLIYEYQARGSLSSLFSRYEQSKTDLPWSHRLSIMSGIARGLAYTERESYEETAPHGNLKPSNILLSETGEALISEYGIWDFIDVKRVSLYSLNGYIAPERRLTKEADIFSFGVIILELLTGKIVEKTSVNLPKWVKFMVREEWTGEVFDREVNRAGRPWAFPLLNVALKCVSDLPEHRPSILEVLEKIEHVVNSQEDHSFSSLSSVESIQQDHGLINTPIPENHESPRNS